jgi:serpin B
MDMPHSAGPLAVLLSTIALAAACGSPNSAPKAATPTPLPVTAKVAADVTSLVNADDEFGLDLLASPAVEQNGNLVVSPASVATALQMVATGARGRTARELQTVLHHPQRTTLPTEQDTDNTLKISDTVWVQQNLPLEKTFTNTLRSRYAAHIDIADFTTNPDTARNHINATVANQTNGLIPALFPPNSLDSTTRLVLTNAIYLKASWATAFPKKLTAPHPFTKADGSVIQVPMMHSDPDEPAPYGYANEQTYQVVTLPYRGGKLAFTILLPQDNSLTQLMKLLRAKGLPNVLKDVKPTPVTLSMPKFTVRTNLDLTATLASLGMPSAFGPTADFSGITTAEALSIQTVQHDAFIQVDEQGTVAAAATGIGMQTSAARLVPEVTVDHPFLFVITDTTTGAPLFLGRVLAP